VAAAPGNVQQAVQGVVTVLLTSAWLHTLQKCSFCIPYLAMHFLNSGARDVGSGSGSLFDKRIDC
jgi:hypothetical protein